MGLPVYCFNMHPQSKSEVLKFFNKINKRVKLRYMQNSDCLVWTISHYTNDLTKLCRREFYISYCSLDNDYLRALKIWLKINKWIPWNNSEHNFELLPVRSELRFRHDVFFSIHKYMCCIEIRKLNDILKLEIKRFLSFLYELTLQWVTLMWINFF